MLLSLLGERLYRKLSLLLQGFLITAFVMMILLFPSLRSSISDSSGASRRFNG